MQSGDKSCSDWQLTLLFLLGAIIVAKH